MFDKFLAAAITSSNVTTLGGLVAEKKTKTSKTSGTEMQILEER